MAGFGLNPLDAAIGDAETTYGLSPGLVNPTSRVAAPGLDPTDQQVATLNAKEPGTYAAMTPEEFEGFKQKQAASSPGHTRPFSAGLESGAITASMPGNLLQALGVKYDSPTLYNAGKSVQDLRARGTKGLEPRVGSIADVHSAGDAWDYAKFQAGNAIGSSAPSIITGVLATFVTENPILGMAAGAAAPSYLANTDEAYGTFRDSPGIAEQVKAGNLTPKQIADYALLTGVPLTALDVFGQVETLGLSKVFGGSALDKATIGALKKSVMGRLVNAMAHGAKAEAGTETTQQAIQEGVSAVLGDKTPASQRVINVLDSAIGGLLGGGAVGGGAHAIQEVASRGQPAQPVPGQAPAAPSADPAAAAGMGEAGSPTNQAVAPSAAAPTQPGRPAVDPATGATRVYVDTPAETVPTPGQPSPTPAPAAPMPSATPTAPPAGPLGRAMERGKASETAAAAEAMVPVGTPVAVSMPGVPALNVTVQGYHADGMDVIDDSGEVHTLPMNDPDVTVTPLGGTAPMIASDPHPEPLPEGVEPAPAPEVVPSNSKGLDNSEAIEPETVPAVSPVEGGIREAAVAAAPKNRPAPEGARETKPVPFSFDVAGKKVAFPSDGLASLYDVGQRRNSFRQGGRDTSGADKLIETERQRTADLLGIPLEDVNKASDEYRHMVEQAAKSSKDAAQVAPTFDPKTLTAARDAWDGMEPAARKVLLDRAGVKRSPKMKWDALGATIQNKIQPAMNGPTLEEAAHEAATSPQNDRNEPTQAQKEAGNYKLGHHAIGGLDLSIENPEGSERKGVDPNGKPWSVKMKSHYGYIKGTVGFDKDHVDVFVKPGTESDLPDSAPVFVVDQIDPKTGALDEHKVLIGWKSGAEARQAYSVNYAKGWKGLGAITRMGFGDFKDWLKNGDMSRPAAEAKAAPRDGAHAGVSTLAKREGQVPEPEKPTLSQLRRARDSDARAVGGELPDVSTGRRDKAVSGDDVGARGQREGIRTGERALGDSEGAGAEPTQEQTALNERSNADGGGLGSGNEPGAVNDSVSSREGDEPSGSDNDAVASRPAAGEQRSNPLQEDQEKESRSINDTSQATEEKPSDSTTPAAAQESKQEPAEPETPDTKADEPVRVETEISAEGETTGEPASKGDSDESAIEQSDKIPTLPAFLDERFGKGWAIGPSKTAENEVSPQQYDDAFKQYVDRYGVKPYSAAYYVAVMGESPAQRWLNMTMPARQALLEHAGVKRSPKSAWDGLTAPIRDKLSRQMEMVPPDAEVEKVVEAEKPGEKKAKRERKAKPPRAIDRAENYFRPGRVVSGYAGKDEVLAFHRGEDGHWSVDVRAAHPDGTPNPKERVRNHSTFPEKRELARWEKDNPVGSLPKATGKQQQQESRRESIPASDDEQFAAGIMAELAANDELFDYPRSNASTLKGVFKDVDPEIKYVGEATQADEQAQSGAERKTLLRTAAGQDFYIYETPDSVWLDVSQVPEGGGGNAIYAAVTNFAHNTSQTFIGDPAGLSDTALRRRTDAMLSSALKFGTTQHLAPHPYQLEGNEKLGVPPLRWNEGDHGGNIQSLIETSVASLRHDVKDLDSASFDHRAGTFRDAKGAPLSDEAFRKWNRAARRIGTTSAGERTLKRGVLLNTLLRAESGERPGLLAQALRRADQLVTPSLKGTFYSTPKAESARGMSPDEVKAAIGQTPLAEPLGRLIDSGRLKIEPTADSAAEAYTDADGTIHLVAPNLAPDAVQAAVLHEAFHSGVRPLIGDKAWSDLLRRLRSLYNQARGSRGGARAVYDKALARMAHAQEASGPFSEELTPEEFGAYVISEHEAMPRAFGDWAREVIGAVKAWALRRVGVQLGAVTPDQLRGLAIAAIRDQAAGTAPREMSAGRRESVTAPTTAETAQAERAMPRTAEELSDIVKGLAADLRPKALGFLPLNTLTDWAAPNQPAVQQYIDTKRKMDAYRNKKQNEADAILQRWQAAISKGGENAAALASVMHDATLLGFDPAKPHDGWQGNPSNVALVKRYKALTPNAQAVYEEVRDAFKAENDLKDKLILDSIPQAMGAALRDAERARDRDLADIRDDGLTGEAKEAAEKAARDKFKRTSSKIKFSMKARQAALRSMFEMNKGPEPYFPLSRFGQHFVTVRNEVGKMLSFSLAETTRQRKAIVKEMRARHPHADIKDGVLDDKTSLSDQMDPRVVADIQAILGNAGVSDDVRDQIWQRYIKSLPDLSIRRRSLHRSGVAGFNTDAMRAFANHMFHSAYQTGRMKYGADLLEHVNQASEQAHQAKNQPLAMNVANELKKRHEWVMNPRGSSLANRATTIGFLYFLGASPASAAVNLSQTVIMGVPILGSRFGMGKATAALTKASHDFVSGKGGVETSGNLSVDERAAIAALYDRGALDRSQAHDLAGVAEFGAEYNPTRQRVMRAMAYLFHNAERFNREVTALAAYRLARGAGMSHGAAVDKAGELTWLTHFDYASSNRPRIMQNDVAKVALLFKNFQINMIYRLFRDTQQAFRGASPQAKKEARYQLAGVMAMYGLMAGGLGVPLMKQIIIPLWKMMFGDDDDKSAEEEFRGAVLNTLGPQLGGVALDGVPGYLTGTSLTQRIGMADLWFHSDDRVQTAKDWWDSMLSEAAGPVVGLARNIFNGVNVAIDGKGVARGVEMVMPTFAKNLMKAWRYGQEGVVNMRGDQVVAPENIGLHDALKQALGFTPAAVAEQYTRNNEKYNMDKRIGQQRKQLLDGYAKARKAGDEEAMTAALADIHKFNAEPNHAAKRITGKTIRESVRTRARLSNRAENGIVIQNRRQNAILNEQMPPRVY